MTIDQVVKQYVHKILTDGHFCTSSYAQKVADTTAKAIQNELITHEIQTVKSDLDKTILRLERLWTIVDTIQSPKRFVYYSKINKFFHFRWLKFWNYF